MTADQISRECADLLLWDIVPQQPGERIKAWMHRAAVVTGFKQSYVKRLRYQEVNRVPADVADQIRVLAARTRAARERAAILRAENERLLDDARAGRRLVLRQAALPTGLDAASSTVDLAEQDPRQLSLPFSGWRR